MSVTRRNLLGAKLVEAENQTATISDQCLAYNAVSCRTCEDHCEHDAIRFKPVIGGAYLPSIQDSCIACGDCLPACPVSAITISLRASEGTA